MCVQRFDGSLKIAIHITYRISLRSSSMPEPRDPLLKVLNIIYFLRHINYKNGYDFGKHMEHMFTKATGYNIQDGRYTQKGHFSLMILPQVHLRKPCYDFYFL